MCLSFSHFPKLQVWTKVLVMRGTVGSLSLTSQYSCSKSWDSWTVSERGIEIIKGQDGRVRVGLKEFGVVGEGGRGLRPTNSHR